MLKFKTNYVMIDIKAVLSICLLVVCTNFSSFAQQNFAELFSNSRDINLTEMPKENDTVFSILTLLTIDNENNTTIKNGANLDLFLVKTGFSKKSESSFKKPYSTKNMWATKKIYSGPEDTSIEFIERNIDKYIYQVSLKFSNDRLKEDFIFSMLSNGWKPTEDKDINNVSVYKNENIPDGSIKVDGNDIILEIMTMKNFAKYDKN